VVAVLRRALRRPGPVNARELRDRDGRRTGGEERERRLKVPGLVGFLVLALAIAFGIWIAKKLKVI
jgi:hypothetical protein